MCLAVPGKVVRLFPASLPMADVAFGELVKAVCIACLPDVEVGEYVIVHAGFAIGRVDPVEAQENLATLETLTQSVPDGVSP